MTGPRRRRVVHYCADLRADKTPIMFCDDTPAKLHPELEPRGSIYITDKHLLLTARAALVTCVLCKDKLSGVPITRLSDKDLRAQRAMNQFLSPFGFTYTDAVDRQELWDLLARAIELAESECEQEESEA